MTIRQFTFEELLAYLTANGCQVASDEFFDEHNRIMIRKGSITFPLQFREAVSFHRVVRLCWDLEIEPPADHLKVYMQYQAMKRKAEGNPGPATDTTND